MDGGTIKSGGAVRGTRRDYFGVKLQVDASGRRQWTTAIARRLAEESLASDLSVEQFAEEWDLGKTMISRWRMQLLREREHAETDSGRPEPAKPLFAHAVVDRLAVEIAPKGDSHILIERGDLRVTLPGEADPKLVVGIVTALGGRE